MNTKNIKAVNEEIIEKTKEEIKVAIAEADKAPKQKVSEESTAKYWILY